MTSRCTDHPAVSMTQKEQPTIADEPGEYNKSLSNFNGGTA